MTWLIALTTVQPYRAECNVENCSCKTTTILFVWVYCVIRFISWLTNLALCIDVLDEPLKRIGEVTEFDKSSS